VNERSAVMLGALAGAIAGGAFGYLYLTGRGRELRDDLEPAMSDLLSELQRAWESAERARVAVNNAWAAMPSAAEDGVQDS